LCARALKAAELHSLLDAELGAWFGKAGFRRSRRSPLTYRRRAADGTIEVAIQCDRWGFDTHAGGEFFVNFRLLSGDGGVVREERCNHFLTDAELEVARDLRDRIVARIPRPPVEYFERLPNEFSRYPDGRAMLAALRAQFEPQRDPFRRSHDMSHRYRTAEDVHEWVTFIGAVLPRAVQTTATWLADPGSAAHHS